MSGYAAFPTDVREHFHPIIVAHGFVVEKEASYVVTLRSKTCLLVLDLDRMDLRVRVANPHGDPREYFGVSRVHTLLYPDEKPTTKPRTSFKLTSRESLRKQLTYYATLMQERLTHVLHGDFSWAPAYREENQRMQNMIRFIRMELDRHHPISQKFRNADPTWQADLIAYLEANNITL